MSAERDPVERVLDLVVFAPIGAVVVAGGFVRMAAERVPVDGVRERVCTAVAMARGVFQAAGATVEEPASVVGTLDTVVADVVDAAVVDDVPDAADLAIEGYDHLAARQVVDRLDGLSADELIRIERYETAHRRRRTVLGKIEQLYS